ncbi:hypothetical protein AMECASPLE_028650 [Ameca splendens]|uniref:Uncharacterized protein n=1 Tax=Ameca splendens TaxID=208324 RepID=A0ABV1ABW1_9TELE
MHLRSNLDLPSQFVISSATVHLNTKHIEGHQDSKSPFIHCLLLIRDQSWRIGGSERKFWVCLRVSCKWHMLENIQRETSRSQPNQMNRHR